MKVRAWPSTVFVLWAVGIAVRSLIASDSNGAFWSDVTVWTTALLLFWALPLLRTRALQFYINEFYRHFPHVRDAAEHRWIEMHEGTWDKLGAPSFGEVHGESRCSRCRMRLELVKPSSGSGHRQTVMRCTNCGKFLCEQCSPFVIGMVRGCSCGSHEVEHVKMWEVR